MFCPQCGTAYQAGFKFCKHCGAVLPAAGTVAAASPEMAPPPPPPPPAPPLAYAAAGQQVYAAAGQYVYAAGQSVAAVTQQAAVLAHNVQRTHLMQNLSGRIQRLASTESLEGFSLKQMFSEVFKRRGQDEVEDYIMAGTSKTTPPIELVETGWPKPWLFFRVLIGLLVAYVGLTFLYMRTNNTNCVPGMMLLGAFAVPLATLTLFFELNTPRNVSLHALVKLFLFGAVVSLGVALLGYALPIFDISEMEAGIVEEVAKLLTVVLVMRTARYPYILNGILFGATVGAGFACFETAGYALNMGLIPGLLPGLQGQQQVTPQAMHAGVVAMLQLLRLRGIEAPLGHVAWTAIAAGAFWRVKRDKPSSVSMVFDHRFLKAFLIPVCLHAIWDAPWQLPFAGNQIITGLISWYVVFGLVQQGLRQVQAEQKAQLQTTLAGIESGAGPVGAVLTPVAAAV
jgi:RsiW-degrading membrane proteinase PrsW (M82 family)